MEEPLRVAINGFGRIGRAAFKVAFERDDIEVVALNDLGSPETLAYLLQYDSIYGRYEHSVSSSDHTLTVGGAAIPVTQVADPSELPWKEKDVDVVIESTGVFTESEGARKHLDAGAKRVVVSAPTKSDDMATIVLGVNDHELEQQDVISNASCTTNCAAPVAAVLDNVFGIEKALLTTIHAYTSTQNLVDSPHKKDPRRGRAAAYNLVPASTGAAIAATKAYSSLDGKFDGVALRVPVPIVSMADFVFLLKKEVRVEEVNQALAEAVTNLIYKDVLGVTDEPAVSTDFIQDPRSAIVDLAMTRVVGGDLVKVMAWYDNEWGYSNRLVENVIEIGRKISD